MGRNLTFFIGNYSSSMIFERLYSALYFSFCTILVELRLGIFPEFDFWIGHIIIHAATQFRFVYRHIYHIKVPNIEYLANSLFRLCFCVETSWKSFNAVSVRKTPTFNVFYFLDHVKYLFYYFLMYMLLCYSCTYLFFYLSQPLELADLIKH